MYPRSKKWDTGMTINGFLGGLVAITCPCYWVSAPGAIAIGAIAGIVVPLGVSFIEWLRIDDPIGAVAVHGFAGIWGTISVGLFGAGLFGLPTTTGADNQTFVITGLFYGGGTTVLVAQMIGSAIITVATFSVAYVVMWAVNAIGQLRVSAEGEIYGLDLHEHGISAYPEYVITSMGSPAGMTSSSAPKAPVAAPVLSTGTSSK